MDKVNTGVCKILADIDQFYLVYKIEARDTYFAPHLPCEVYNMVHLKTLYARGYYIDNKIKNMTNLEKIETIDRNNFNKKSNILKNADIFYILSKLQKLRKCHLGYFRFNSNISIKLLKRIMPEKDIHIYGLNLTEYYVYIQK